MGARLRIGLLLPAIAVVAAAGQAAAPGWRAAIVAGGIGTAASVLLIEQLRWVRKLAARGPGPFDRAMRPVHRPPERPADLVALERSFGYGTYEPDEFDTRLKPILQHIYLSVMAEAMDKDIDRSTALELLFREGGSDRAVDTADLVALVDAIETAGR